MDWRWVRGEKLARTPHGATNDTAPLERDVACPDPLSLFAAAQNRFDAVALLLNSTNQEAGMSERCRTGYTCSVANIRGLDSPGIELDARR
jgi:hypothetical protein